MLALYNWRRISTSLYVQANTFKVVFKQILAVVLNFADSQDKEDSGYGIWKEMWRCQYSGVTKIGTCMFTPETLGKSLQ